MAGLEEVNWKNTVEFVPLVTGGKVIKVYDCDTITIATQIPYKSELAESKVFYRFHIRLNGIDTPEIKSANEDDKSIAKLAQKALSNLIMDKNVTLKNTSIDKYGRILADVYDDKDLHLNKWILDNRFAVVYDGGTKNPPKSWSEYHKSGKLI